MARTARPWPRGSHPSARRIDAQFAVAQTIKKILRQVAQRHQFAGVQEPGAALDGVETAKDLVQQGM
jgi:hypothetical protein